MENIDLMKVKCTCKCHEDPAVMHIRPCCVDGFIEVPDPPEKIDPPPSTRDRLHNYRTTALPPQKGDKHIDELK